METALNTEGRRKTANLVVFYNGERLFEDEALSAALKSPTTSFWFLTHILGKRLENIDVAAFQRTFPQYTLEEDAATGYPIFVLPDGETKYSVEELVGR